jgi:Na+-transporting methylmalonyl-CoA/oxaloacetate decarboxylase gamma subunit
VLTLVVATAAMLGVTMVAALVAILIFVMHIRGFLAETSSALEVVDQRASRFAERLERIQPATHAAASHLARSET